MFWMKVKYRTRYYYKAVMHLVGFCPKCFSLLSYTRIGKPFCTACGYK